MRRRNRKKTKQGTYVVYFLILRGGSLYGMTTSNDKCLHFMCTYLSPNPNEMISMRACKRDVNKNAESKYKRERKK